MVLKTGSGRVDHHIVPYCTVVLKPETFLQSSFSIIPHCSPYTLNPKTLSPVLAWRMVHWVRKSRGGDRGDGHGVRDGSKEKHEGE